MAERQNFTLTTQRINQMTTPSATVDYQALRIAYLDHLSNQDCRERLDSIIADSKEATFLGLNIYAQRRALSLGYCPPCPLLAAGLGRVILSEIEIFDPYCLDKDVDFCSCFL